MISMKPTIMYLHGLGATPLSFRYISGILPDHNQIFIEMSVDDLVRDSVKAVEAGLRETGAENVTIVGHSLGGIVGVGLLKLPSIRGLITLSTPFGGHAAALLLGLWHHGAMFRNLSPYGSTIRTLQTKWDEAKKPHRAIVSAKGLPIMGEPNDSVVTVASQQALTGPEYILHDHLNHFEVLLSDEVANQIRSFTWQTPPTPTDTIG